MLHRNKWTMFFKIAVLCVALACIHSDTFVKGEESSSPASNIGDGIKQQMELFRNYIDQALAKAVDDVNVKQVQPVLGVVGDQLNRFSKAFEDLTAKNPPAND